MLPQPKFTFICSPYKNQLFLSLYLS
jgi:hypothetical protein